MRAGSLRPQRLRKQRRAMARPAIPHRAPADLAMLPAWLAWRREQLPHEAKPRKTPYYVDGARRHGRNGSPEDRSRLTTFPAARDFAIRRGFDGVGFAPLPEFGITALDFDHCVGPDGQIPSEILDIVGHTYAEFSPSGTGIRAFVKGDLGNRKTKATADSFGFETFSTAGFVTCTGEVLPICESTGADEMIAEVSEPLLKLCEARFGSREAKITNPDDPFAGHEPRLGLSPEEIEDLLKKLDPGMGRDGWIRVGMSIHHECEGDDTGLEIWDNWSCAAANYVSREDLETQWASFDRRAGSGPQVTMRSVLKMVKDAGHKLALVRSGPESFTGDNASEGERFRAYTPRELLQRPAAGWWVKRVLPDASLVVVFGESGSGKSFAVLDIVLSIARGAPWAGRKTRKGNILYVAAEGGGGFRSRLEAYEKAHGVDLGDLPIHIVIEPPNFLGDADVEHIVDRAISKNADVVVVDTLAQVTPGGNENGSEDMGRALSRCRAIHERTGATLILVHHAGKDRTKGARGWSGLRAAADAEIEVSRNGARRFLKITKMKDGRDGEQFAFELRDIVVGQDEDGESRTSCVVSINPVVQSAAASRNSPSGKVQRLIVNSVEQWADIAAGVPRGELEARVAGQLDFDPGPSLAKPKRDQRDSNVRRAIGQLIERGVIVERDGRLYLPDAAPADSSEGGGGRDA